MCFLQHSPDNITDSTKGTILSERKITDSTKGPFGKMLSRAAALSTTRSTKRLTSLLSVLSLSTLSSPLPARLGRTERKPLVTGITELKRRARKEREARREVREFVLRPPDNGVLVESLVPVAREVFEARRRLFGCVNKVSERIPVHSCRICGEVHVGRIPHKIRTCNFSNSLSTKEHSWAPGKTEHILPKAESFHLYDRLGRAVSHSERLQVDRIPAIVELCIQAGVNLPEYPTKRREFPVYNVAGKIMDFEKNFPRDFTCGKDIETDGFWQWRNKTGEDDFVTFPPDCSIQEVAIEGMKAWETVRKGVRKLMKKYPVQTCGFCPEVQVGPKGHRARICQAYKHQQRSGQHAWQAATPDDLLPPVPVWRARGPEAPLWHDLLPPVPVWRARGPEAPLRHELRAFYARLPAAVELFAQAGARVPEEWEEAVGGVAVPGLEEERLVV